eukprot:6725477-Prymnesium_polylepis.1
MKTNCPGHLDPNLVLIWGDHGRLRAGALVETNVALREASAPPHAARGQGRCSRSAGKRRRGRPERARPSRRQREGCCSGCR